MRSLLTALAAFAWFAAECWAAGSTPTFASRTDYVRLYTRVTVITDVNNDGNPDLLATLGGVLNVLLGNGKGEFVTAPSQDLAASGAIQIVPMDLNSDGKVDLILNSTQGNTAGITVSLGNGDGTFALGNFYSVQNDGNGLGGMAIGDFNGDSKVDVVTPGDSGLWFLAGNGDGTLKQPIMLTSLEAGATGATAADFDGDGKLDVVITLGSAGQGGLGDGFQLYFGNGDGTFRPPLMFGQPRRAARVVAGSLRRGGAPAIVMTDYSSTNAWVFVNDGKGNFSKPYLTTLPGVSDIALGDLDNDGYTDLVSSLGYVAYGAAGGTFPVTKYYPILAAGSSQFTVAVGDLRHTGNLDIVTDSQDAISVLFNQGERMFRDGNWTPLTGGGACGASGDFNGDGLSDLAISNSTGISILLGTGATAHPWKSGQVLPLSGAGCPVLGDLNQDGTQDLLVHSGLGAVSFLGKGDGTFYQSSVTPTSADGHLVLGDFNHDGNLDFATSANLLAYGRGDGTFGTPTSFVSDPPFGGFSWIEAEDLNNDGWPDLVLTNLNTSNINVYSMINNRRGGFTHVDSGCGPQSVQLNLADLNGDGIPDMVINYLSGSGAGICFGDGQGHFTLGPGLAGPVPTSEGTNVVGDFNGDGIIDIGVLAANSISIYPGLGGGTFGAGASFGAGRSPTSVLPVSIRRPYASGFARPCIPRFPGRYCDLQRN